MQKLYSPPEGFYDLPFIWTFDASALNDGQDYPNQFVYLQGGYGDFIMRRIVGLSRILDPATGQYQINDRQGSYIEADKVFGGSADDLMIVPEQRYPETGAVRFDLFKILKPAVTNSAQLAFQGVRRMAGPNVARPNYKAKPKSFTYILPVTLTDVFPVLKTVHQTVNDYDFELEQIMIFGLTRATVIVTGPGSLHADAVELGPGGNGITITTVQAGLNTPLSIATNLGTRVITVHLQTDARGAVLSTEQDVKNAVNADPTASSLITMRITGGTELSILPGGISVQTVGGSVAGLTEATSRLWVYDRNKVQISNAPVVDLYLQGAPDSTYEDGALVPPLYYPQNAQIQIDIGALTTDPTTLPLGFQIYLIGKQWIPC